MKGHNDIRAVAQKLSELPHHLHGQVETHYHFAEEPTPEQLRAVQEVATDSGWAPEEESHELEGRHMLTLTWHF